MESKLSVSCVQITVSEEFAGSRAGYYDRSGALRDMIQNHVMAITGSNHHGATVLFGS